MPSYVKLHGIPLIDAFACLIEPNFVVLVGLLYFIVGEFFTADRAVELLFDPPCDAGFMKNVFLITRHHNQRVFHTIDISTNAAFTSALKLLGRPFSSVQG
jgi:hypothetical protein